MADQAAATKDLLQAVRERKRQEQDPLFIASQLYGETRDEAGKLRRPKQSREERAALRQQLYKAVEGQIVIQDMMDEQQAGEAMRQAIIVGEGLGRPTDWHPVLGESLCAWVADGRSLRSWCRQTGISMQGVFRWMNEARRMADGEMFSERYRIAQESRAPDAWADDILRLPDEAAMQNLTLPQVKVLELQVQTRQWLASKLMPKKYGEQRDSTVQGTINISIGIPQKGETTVVEAFEPTAVQLTP